MYTLYQAEIQLPVHLASIASLQAFFNAVSRGLSIDESSRQAVELALEEAMLDLFSYAEATEGLTAIKVNLSFDYDAIVITGRAPGRPFDSRKHGVRSGPLASLDDDATGLSGYMIRRLMDSVRWSYVEKEGQELSMLKKLPSPIQPAFELRYAGQGSPEQPPKGEITCRQASGYEDALAISMCAYDIYRYAYKDVIYYPQELQKRHEEGAIHSWIAVDEESSVFGHYALFRHKKEDMIGEMGAAFVKSECRKGGLFRQLSDVAHNDIQGLGLRGVYSLSVTNHTSTQKSSMHAGRRSVGIRLASTPAIFVEGAKPGDRITSVLNYCPLVRREERVLYLPGCYREIILDSYAWLGLPVSEQGDERSADLPDTVTCHRDITWNRAVITASGGEVSIYKLRSLTEQLCDSGVACILLALYLEHPQTPILVEEARRLGFFYSGILPDSLPGGHDALQLQLLNNCPPLDSDTILLYQDSAKEIMGFIADEVPHIFSRPTK